MTTNIISFIYVPVHQNPCFGTYSSISIASFLLRDIKPLFLALRTTQLCWCNNTDVISLQHDAAYRPSSVGLESYFLSFIEYHIHELIEPQNLAFDSHVSPVEEPNDHTLTRLEVPEYQVDG